MDVLGMNDTCACAAKGGHLEVLKWAQREWMSLG